MADVVWDASAMIIPVTSPADKTDADGTNFPVGKVSFDAATEEHAFVTTKLVGYGGGDLNIDFEWNAETATTSTVSWEITIYALTDGDAQSIETKSGGTVKNVTTAATNSTAKGPNNDTIAMTTSGEKNSAASDDIIWIRVARDVADGGDLMSGDANLTHLHLNYS